MTDEKDFDKAKNFLSKGWDSNQCSFGEYLHVCSKLYDAFKEYQYLKETASSDKEFEDKLVVLETNIDYLLMNY